MGFCVVAAVLALAAQRGRPDVALGVAGGGALIGVSYWAIRSSIDGILALALPATEGSIGPPDLADTSPRAAEHESDPLSGTEGDTGRGSDPGGPPGPDSGHDTTAGRLTTAAGRARAIGYGLRFIGRFAVLAALAYVMLVWLRLHPVGLILGVSSIVVAAAIEAASTLGRAPRG